MNVEMPICDGLEATRRIRVVEACRCRRPSAVIAINDSMALEDRRNALFLGMNDFPPKPFSRDQLAMRLRIWQSR